MTIGPLNTAHIALKSVFIKMYHNNLFQMAMTHLHVNIEVQSTHTSFTVFLLPIQGMQTSISRNKNKRRSWHHKVLAITVIKRKIG